MKTQHSTWLRYVTGAAVAVGMLAAVPAFADDALDQALQSPDNWPTYGRTDRKYAVQSAPSDH